MSYLVGYRPDDRGAEALALGIAGARTLKTGLDVVYVVPPDSPALSEHARGSRVGSGEQRALNAKNTVLETVPDDVPVRFHVRGGDSPAAALIDAAEEFGSTRIVVGASRTGVLGRFTIGSVANALLHSSPVPVVLAPRGYRNTNAFSRLTAGVGEREGWEAVLSTALASTAQHHRPLRLVSLVALDAAASRHGEDVNAALKHANSVLVEAARTLPEGVATEITVGQGRNDEEAIQELDWEDTDLVVIGSSRLAQKRRLFLGATANRMLRALPVPMMVVPRGE
ncbi:universal stress protein [Zafaria sp. J156]|uniref:universal stress protein n=1 Tax=Zafaria sp. J156 TaxID=3116490 RepID=UPI002E7A4712|nr:universal stress protein [Zafaria sp. J156]MEE1621241.1 universal stress protein [Zafaria sp. J156]